MQQHSPEVIIWTGAGQIGMAIARRIAFSKHRNAACDR